LHTKSISYILIEWNANAIKWFLDGTKYWEGDISNNVNSTDEFHAPFFIILNMAIGGTWPGNPDVTTVFPDTMFVDYVRVYQLATSINEKQNLTTAIENYPNPFNGTTTISYSVSKDAEIELNVYNLIGNKIAVLEKGKRISGKHSSVWNSESVAPGIYFLQLKTDDQVIIKKIIVSK